MAWISWVGFKGMPWSSKNWIFLFYCLGQSRRIFLYHSKICPQRARSAASARMLSSLWRLFKRLCCLFWQCNTWYMVRFFQQWNRSAIVQPRTRRASLCACHILHEMDWNKGMESVYFYIWGIDAYIIYGWLPQVQTFGPRGRSIFLKDV